MNVILFAILGLISGVVGSYFLGTIHVQRFRVPYILYIEKVTDEALADCRKDENCMDILPMSDLPQRKDGEPK